MEVTRAHSASAPEAHRPAYRVEAPRASDAIGLALRCAFEDAHALPDDMAAMLRTLNKMELPRSH